jgi:hypothetical protein
MAEAQDQEQEQEKDKTVSSRGRDLRVEVCRTQTRLPRDSKIPSKIPG